MKQHAARVARTIKMALLSGAFALTAVTGAGAAEGPSWYFVTSDGVTSATPRQSFYLRRIALAPDGDFYVVGDSRLPGPAASISVRRQRPNGETVWADSFEALPNTEATLLLPRLDGGVDAVYRIATGARLDQVDSAWTGYGATGEQLGAVTHEDGPDAVSLRYAARLASGEILAGGTSRGLARKKGAPSYFKPYLRRIGIDGKIISEELLADGERNHEGGPVAADAAGRIFALYTELNGDDPSTVYLRQLGEGAPDQPAQAIFSGVGALARSIALTPSGDVHVLVVANPTKTPTAALVTVNAQGARDTALAWPDGFLVIGANAGTDAFWAYGSAPGADGVLRPAFLKLPFDGTPGDLTLAEGPLRGRYTDLLLAPEGDRALAGVGTVYGNEGTPSVGFILRP